MLDADIFANLPSSKTVLLKPRYAYIIVGKPGCGKSVLGKRIAEYTKAKWISPKECLEDYLRQYPAIPPVSSIETEGAEVEVSPANMDAFIPGEPSDNIETNGLAALLRSGQVVTHKSIIELLSKTLSLDSTDFTGFVIDAMDDVDLKLIKVAVNKRGIVPVIVQLHISDENLITRRAGRWMDPLTGKSYPGQQVLYSNKRILEGFKEGDVDLVAQAENLARSPAPIPEKQKSMKDANENATEDQEEPTEIEILSSEEARIKSSQVKMPTPTTSTLANKKTWSILSISILNRLLKNPEDDPLFFQNRIQEYETIEKQIKEFRIEHFNILNIVDLDATQHPDTVFEQMQKRMLIRGYSIFNPVILPIVLQPQEGGLKGNFIIYLDIMESDILRHYANWNLADQEQPRELGIFMKSCPVAYYLHGTNNDCDLALAVSYKVHSKV